MAIVLFEDQRCETLAPMALARPAAAISCASFRLIDWLELLFPKVYSIVRPHLAAIQRADYPFLKDLCSDGEERAAGDQEVTLLLNARIAPTAANLQALQMLDEKCEELGSGQSYVVMHGEQVAAVIHPAWSLHYLVGAGFLGSEEWLNKAKGLPQIDIPLQLLNYPHEVVSLNASCFQSNLAVRSELLDSGMEAYAHYDEIAPGVLAAPGVTVGSYVAFDTSAGPIYLERGVNIRSFANLIGPAYIGEGTEILEHASIKNSVSIGRSCRVGGEVQASVIESYSDKPHSGYLGYSYLGSWVSLGPGTSVSALKNNLGTVFIDYEEGKVSTETPFMGCIFGDFSKTAVNTGILTGKRIGVCSLLYGFAAIDVPSFLNFAPTFGQISEVSPDQAVGIWERMAALKSVALRNCDYQLLRDLHNLTQIERDCASEMISG